MPSRLTILALVAGLLAILLSPQIASSSITQGAIIEAPPKFVRDKTLDYDFIRGLQKPNIPGHLDALMLTRNKNKMSAVLALKQEILELRGTGPRRTAKVVTNMPSRMVYSEDFAHGQRILHTLRFRDAGSGGTKFEYEKKWKGSLALMFLGKVGVVKPVGGPITAIGAFKEAVEDAYDKEFALWGGARYE